jgi:adenylyltransferase/sulfurtransferase
MDICAERYSRHLLVESFTPEHQQKLADAKVFVLGAGGLGSPLLLYLAAAGVGHLAIADFDVISESNLNRQILYHDGIIGNAKALEAANRVKQLNADCQVTNINEKITAENCAALIEPFDLVADATDNYSTRYIIDNYCRQVQKPYVFASAEQMGGQLSVFHYNGAKGYRDLFPTPPEPSANPPGIIGAAAGIIGSLEAMEVIKIITGLGTPLCRKLLVINTLENSFQTYSI